MDTNAFDILGLPVAFEIDPVLLQKRMIQLAAANHPDRYTDPLDQADAAQRAAVINEAHRTLRDPLQRAQLLLALLSGSAARDEKALPPDLLMQMMEVREELEDAIASQDDAALARLRQWASDEQASHSKAMGDELTAALATDGDGKAAHLQQAQIHLNTLRYLARMIQQMPA